MEKAYFTDLDSTIICSGVTGDDLVCVATKHGKNTSFMRENTKKLFKEITSNIITVPITTRCEASYNNIFLKELFRHALVDNGAILITEDLHERETWINESYLISSYAREQFDQCRKIIESYGYTEKWGSDFVLDYICKEKNEESIMGLKAMTENFPELLVNIRNTSVTVTFKCLSKGEAIKRYINRFGVFPYLSSGDSTEDESMFDVTEQSIGKRNATFCFYTKDKLAFCDYVIRKARELIK